MPRRPLHIDTEALLTLAEVGVMFRVTPQRVAVWDRAGKLGGAVIKTPGGQRRFRASAILALLAGQAEGGDG